MSEDTVHPCIHTMNFFGANFEKYSEIEWSGDCLMCGASKKVYVNNVKGLWDCKRCGASGNQSSFLNQFYSKMAKVRPSNEAYVKLEETRGLPRMVFEQFGLAHHQGKWHIPVRNVDGKIVDIRKYSMGKLISPKGVDLGLWNADSLANLKSGIQIWWCEGEWDGMAMWYLLNRVGMHNKEKIVAIPGAGTLKPAWLELIRNHKITTLYDADEAGVKGEKKFHERAKGVAAAVQHVHWPMSAKNGFDTRDYVTDNLVEGESPSQLFINLNALAKPYARADAKDVRDETRLGEEKPITFKELVKAFEKRMMMTDDLRDALKICAAVCLSIDIPGDPIWVYLVGAPGFGKTMILGATADSERCVLRSTVTAHSFVSGWRGEGTKDPSLIPKLIGKTFVCKDFTEILTMPKVAQDEVFSTLRGAYDGVVQKTFGNGVTREYKDCRFAMLAGVTHSINGHKQSSLGERFLKFQMRRSKGKHSEDVLDAAIASVGNEAETESELKNAFRGFLLNRIDIESLPTLPDHLKQRLKSLVQLIAFLRAQVERHERTDALVFRPEPEAGTRLAKQLMKLAMCISNVESEKIVSKETYELVERVALDTAVGFHLDLVDVMFRAGKPLPRDTLAKMADIPYISILRHLEDLALLKVVVETKCNDAKIGRPKLHYHISPHVEALWKQAKGIQATLKLKRSRVS